MLIGVSGRKFNGKDTFADYLVKQHGFIKIAFADNLKEACRIIYGFSDRQLYGDLKEVKDEYWGKSPREILQFVGTNLLRNQFLKEIWIKSLEKKMMDIKKNNKFCKIIVSDCRFQNEVDMVNEHGGFVVRVTRPSVNNIKDMHESEKNINKLTGVKYDILNDGTLDNLYRFAENIYEKEFTQLSL